MWNIRGFVGFAALTLSLTTGCSKDPELAKRRFLQAGDQYVTSNKNREAVIEYRNAIALDARFGEARLKLADAYMRLGDTQNALREYGRAADLMPTNVVAQMKIGQM